MYDLRSLGWSSFQQLCLTIVREVLGQTVESYLDSNDAGQDGAFSGCWNPTGQEYLTGRFVIQCKFTSKTENNLRPSDLADEVTKVKKLVERGLCDVYVLITNAGISGNQAIEIESLFKGAGVKHVKVFGSTWINQQIRENKRLRMLVPRVYGLGDLSQILDERAYTQARAILESLREDLAKVVVTDAYRKAVAALDQHGFVLLIGEPAAGKTTIASMLAMAAIDQWGASILKLDDPRKVIEHWNPDEPSQFFWLDDAFGVTQYEAHLVHGWNHIFQQINSMLRKGARIVMTSRDYIYNRARNDLKEVAFPLMKESKVVIDVHDLSSDEKRQILYNHLKLGRQPQTFRSNVKPFLESVAAHSRFIPEIARRLADPLFTEGLHLDTQTLAEFVDKREQLLQEILKGLDNHCKAALALIYMRNDHLESPITLQKTEEQALERLGSNLGGCRIALEALKDSLVLHTHASGDAVWRFKHPTIGDAYAAILVQSPELLGIYIHGSAPEKLIEQVTCGDVGIERAIIIPKVLFPAILTKLGQISASKNYKDTSLATWGAERAVHGFLANRCSKDFLSLYLEKHPKFLDAVSTPGLYLKAVSEIDVAIRLHELGLLPEDNRKTFVATVSEYAVTGEDMSAVDDDDIRKLFKRNEKQKLLEDIRTTLIPKLTSVRVRYQLNHDSSESAEDHMQPLLDSLSALRERFKKDPEAIKIIDRETNRANQWVDENPPEDEERMPSRKLGNVEISERAEGERSIFDDIDT